MCQEPVLWSDNQALVFNEDHVIFVHLNCDSHFTTMIHQYMLGLSMSKNQAARVS